MFNCTPTDIPQCLIILPIETPQCLIAHIYNGHLPTFKAYVTKLTYKNLAMHYATDIFLKQVQISNLSLLSVQSCHHVKSCLGLPLLSHMRTHHITAMNEILR